MPTYEYRCPEGHEFERFYRKISDATGELPCPECGQPAVRVLSAGAGLLFKGSGFYLTDYGKNAHRKAGPASTKSETQGGDSASTESGSKPESKPDTSSAKTDAGTSKPERSTESSGESKKRDAKPSSTPKSYT
jgi:putative FmdB family regulatory protein